jgi:hypothetical protein
MKAFGIGFVADLERDVFYEAAVFFARRGEDDSGR